MKNGYYWVKIQAHFSWEVARYVDGGMYLTGVADWKRPTELAVIGPRVPEPSDKRSWKPTKGLDQKDPAQYE